MRGLIRTGKGLPQGVLIHRLNPVIRGWGNDYRHVVSKETFDVAPNGFCFPLLQHIAHHYRRRRHEAGLFQGRALLTDPVLHGPKGAGRLTCPSPATRGSAGCFQYPSPREDEASASLADEAGAGADSSRDCGNGVDRPST
ncbi:MAG: group II intron maturase-specific domain-containing protein [Halochromatium sp.]